MARHFVTALLLLSCVIYMASAERFETRINRAWAGGFQGIVDLPPWGSAVTGGWHIIISFPHNVFDFEACEVEVVDFNDHLDERFKERPRSQLILSNRDWNADLAADEPIEFKFLAKTWDRRKGFTGTVEFVNSPYVEE